MAVPLFNLAPNLTVSRLCLGTMTFSKQNPLCQSFRLLDEPFHSGINFFDSAEMYPVPQRAETQGRSQEYLGRWIRERKIPRDRLVVATKPLFCNNLSLQVLFLELPSHGNSRRFSMVAKSS